MKKSLMILISLIMLIPLILSAGAADIKPNQLQAAGQKTFEVVMAKKRPTIDGKISENEYGEYFFKATLENGLYISKDGEALNTEEGIDLSVIPEYMKIYAVYDDQYLFIAVEVAEDKGNSIYTLSSRVGFDRGDSIWSSQSYIGNTYRVTYTTEYVIGSYKTVLQDYVIKRYNADGTEKSASRKWDKKAYPCPYWSGRSTNSDGKDVTVYEFAYNWSEIENVEMTNGIPSNGYIYLSAKLNGTAAKYGYLVFSIPTDKNNAPGTQTTLYDTFEGKIKYIPHVLHFNADSVPEPAPSTTAAPQTEEAETPESEGGQTALYIGIATGVIIVAAVVLIFVFKKKK